MFEFAGTAQGLFLDLEYDTGMFAGKDIDKVENMMLDVLNSLP